jgi:hypothetical protein
MIDSDAEDDPKSLKFTTIPTWQAFISPVAASTTDDIPVGDRAAPANMPPALDTSAWLRELTRIGGIKLSRSPILVSRGDSSGWVQNYSGKDILVERWYAPKAFFSLWLSPDGRYPTSGYPLTARPVIHDWTESIEIICGTEMHLASFRLIQLNEPPEYHVHAYWRVRDDMWARVAAHGDSRTAQEHLLVMVRSAEAIPQSGVAV